MKRPYNLFVLGNAVVDRLMHVAADVPHALGIPLGSGKYDARMEEIQAVITTHGPGGFQSGGSAANMADTFCKLGGTAYFGSRLATDAAGLHFLSDLTVSGIAHRTPEEGHTMEVLSLITENGQRSFFSAGPQLRLLPAHLEADIIAQSDYLFIEGYLLFDQAAAVHQAVKIARAVGTKVILTLAVDAVVRHAWPEVAAVIEHGVDLIIANDQELAVLLEQTRIHAQAYGQKFAEIVERTPRLITHGAKGAEFRDAVGHTTFTPTPPVAQVVDTTGAGDGFAAGFLHSYLAGQPIEAALLKGHEIAGKVIGQTGARLLLV